MISSNIWEVSGKITDIKERKNGAVVRVRGEVFRKDIFSMKAEIDCVVRKKTYNILKNLNLKRGKSINFAGHLRLNEDSYLIVDNVS
jgi:hypothetical protein